MGMFDWVDFEIECPSCGFIVRGFQTKSYINYMTTISVEKVPENGVFYSWCDMCNTHIRIKKGKLCTQGVAKQAIKAIEHT